jgi:hypothetical protein
MKRPGQSQKRFVSGPTDAWAAPGVCLSSSDTAKSPIQLEHQHHHAIVTASWQALMDGIIVISCMCTATSSDLLGNRTTSIISSQLISTLATLPGGRPNPAPHLYGDLAKLTSNSHVSAISRSRESKKTTPGHPINSIFTSDLTYKPRGRELQQHSLSDESTCIINIRRFSTRNTPRVSDTGKEGAIKLFPSRARLL